MSRISGGKMLRHSNVLSFPPRSTAHDANEIYYFRCLFVVFHYYYTILFFFNLFFSILRFFTSFLFSAMASASLSSANRAVRTTKTHPDSDFLILILLRINPCSGQTARQTYSLEFTANHRIFFLRILRHKQHITSLTRLFDSASSFIKNSFDTNFV